MNINAFQDYYPDGLSCCYGCGRLNEHGLQIKSYWDGEETVTMFHPEPYHTALPGFVYGGTIASIIDCHGTGSAAAAAYRAEAREMDSEPPLRFVTASLQVDFLRPTPMGIPLEVRGKIEEMKERKVVVSASVRAGKVECARGKIIAVRMPADMMPGEKAE